MTESRTMDTVLTVALELIESKETPDIRQVILSHSRFLFSFH
jgi:hypothetical protein